MLSKTSRRGESWLVQALVACAKNQACGCSGWLESAGGGSSAGSSGGPKQKGSPLTAHDVFLHPLSLSLVTWLLVVQGLCGPGPVATCQERQPIHSLGLSPGQQPPGRRPLFIQWPQPGLWALRLPLPRAASGWCSASSEHSSDCRNFTGKGAPLGEQGPLLRSRPLPPAPAPTGDSEPGQRPFSCTGPGSSCWLPHPTCSFIRHPPTRCLLYAAVSSLGGVSMTMPWSLRHAV